MPAIGHSRAKGRQFKAQLKTLSFKAPIDILAKRAKTATCSPTIACILRRFEIGAGWIKKGQDLGENMCRWKPRRPVIRWQEALCHLGRAAGQDDDDVLASSGIRTG